MKLFSTLFFTLITTLLMANPGYQVGDAVQDFKLRNIDGKQLSMDSYPDAKAFVIVFTCNHCPFSVAYEERLVKLAASLKEQGVQMIAINPNDATKYPEDSYQNMIKRAAARGFNFPYLHDESQAIAQAFGAERTPHVFLVKNDKQRSIAYIGAIDDSAREPKEVEVHYLQNAVDQLLAGKSCEPATTKAVGCSIKWK